ncbi:MAG TPA: hypothetical protein PK772_02570 [Chitinophagaceae bacterium]|nr:hypothetical protein [Chitinophagaceae bacterium]
MQKVLRYLFLIDFIGSCIAFISWNAYRIYQFADSEGVSFGDVYMGVIAKPIMLIPNLLALLGFIVGICTIIGIIKNKIWGNKLAFTLSLISVIAAVATFFIIKRIEGRYVYHSHYFKLYLYVAIPMVITSLFALLSFIKSKPAKGTISN